MYQKQAFGNRVCALALTVILLVGMMPISAFAEKAAVTVDNAALIAGTYQVSDEEAAILTSGGLVAQTHTYTAPAAEDQLIEVDATAKKITAKTYADSGYTWVPAVARIHYEGGTETVAMQNGVGTFTYTGDMYTVQVDYRCQIPVSADTQLALLNAPHNLASAVDNMNKLLSLESFFVEFGGNIDLLYDNMVTGVTVMFGENPVEVTMSDGIEKEAIKALKQQCDSNGGKLVLTTIVAEYKAAADKLAYIQANGQRIKEQVEATFDPTTYDEKNFNVNDTGWIYELSTYDWLNILQNGWKSPTGKMYALNNMLTAYVTILQGQGEASKLQALQKDLANAMKLVLVPNMIEFKPIAEDPWAVLDGTWPIKPGANLNQLVADAVGKTSAYSSSQLKADLLLNQTTLEVNINLFDVTVTVEAHVVAGVDDPALKTVVSTHKETLKITEGTTAQKIAEKITIGDAAFEELAALAGVTKDHFEVKVVHNVAETGLNANASYTIQYYPKSYTVTYDFLGEATGLPTTVPYGYQLTLPAHQTAGKVYDYLISDEIVMQKQVVTIVGDTAIKQSQGKPWTELKLTEVAYENVTDAKVQLVLASPALLSSIMRIRYPDAGLVSIEASSPCVVKAPDYPTSIDGLSWVATTAVVQPSGQVITFENGKATFSGSFTNVQVTYRVEVTGVPDPNEMLGVMNLPAQLRSEYLAQKADMDALCNGGNSDLMRGLAELDRSALSKIDLIKGNLSLESQAAINYLMAHCVNEQSGMLYLHEQLSSYVAQGMGYYYHGTNYEDLLAQLNYVKDNINTIAEDPALPDLLLTALDGDQEKADAYTARVEAVRDGLYAVDISDNAPNKVIDRNASINDLRALGTALAAANTVQTYSQLPQLYLTWSDAEDKADHVTLSVTLIKKNGATVIKTVQQLVLTGQVGHVMSADDIAALQSIRSELEATLGDLTDYACAQTSSPEPQVGWTLQTSQNVTYTYTYKQQLDPIVVSYEAGENTKAYTADQLAEAVSFAAGNAGTVIVNESVQQKAAITVSGKVTFAGAANINQNGFALLLNTEGASITADAALNVQTGNELYAIKTATGSGVFTYTLEKIPVPSFDGHVAAVKPSAEVKASKVKDNYIYLDVRVAGITATQLQAMLTHTADNAQTTAITKLVGQSGNELANTQLVTNGSQVTFTAKNDQTTKEATITYTVIILGDVNGNGRADAGDATQMRLHYQGISVKTDAAVLLAMDMNQNGSLDAGDASRVMIKYMKWDAYESMLK